MRALLYFSVILGITFLTLRFIGLFLDLTYNDLFLALGLISLFGVGLPIYLLERYRYRKNMNRIIRKYQNEEPKEKVSDQKSRSDKDMVSEYPSFRSSKQGLKWGGGNIHGSTATRGSKRSFLKK